MRVFVTGSSGFVGRFAVAGLLERGHTPVGVEREHDVTDADAMAEVLTTHRPDAIVHLAALSSVAGSFRDAQGAFRVNFLGTRTLLDACARHTPRARILLIGSGDAYGGAGPGDPPFREVDTLRPISPYARTKAAAEMLGTLAAERGQDVVRVRPFNHTGPGQRADFVAASFARQLAQIESGSAAPRMAVGNLDSVREFLDVRDVIAAYERLLDPAVPADVYNVATGKGMPVRSLLDTLIDIAGVEVEVVVDPARMRPTDALVGDPARLRARTGWQPERPLRTTLSESFEYWQRELRAA